MKLGNAQPTSLAQLERSIQSATKYLTRHIGAEGRYDYEYHPERRCVGKGYNLLRHAGTTMELYRLVGTDRDDGKIGPSAARSWNYVGRFIVPVSRNGVECACLAKEDVAKLGGSALALLALSSRIQRQGRTNEEIGLIHRLARYLLSQQMEDGHFVSKVNVSTNEPFAFRSVYYAGEAVLALSHAHKITKNPDYLQGCVDGARALLREDHTQSIHGGRYADHWLMKALAELFALDRNPEWLAHLRSVAEPMLTLPSQSNDGTPQVHWLVKASTTGLATRVEALLATLSVELLLNQPDRAQKIIDFIHVGLTLCLKRQIGEDGGRFGDPAAVGGFSQSDAEGSIRIDYVHHVLGAAITLEELSKEYSTKLDKAFSMTQLFPSIERDSSQYFRVFEILDALKT